MENKKMKNINKIEVWEIFSGVVDDLDENDYSEESIVHELIVAVSKIIVFSYDVDNITDLGSLYSDIAIHIAKIGLHHPDQCDWNNFRFIWSYIGHEPRMTGYHFHLSELMGEISKNLRNNKPISLSNLWWILSSCTWMVNSMIQGYGNHRQVSETFEMLINIYAIPKMGKI